MFVILVAVEEAVKLAESLCQFPQKCMRADRVSAYHASYDAKSFKDAYDFELEKGLPIVMEESVKGIHSFIHSFISSYNSAIIVLSIFPF